MSGPISSRVTAPDDVRLPAAADGVEWRAATLGDLDAIVALYAAISAVDHPDWTETREEVEEELTHSWVDLARDTAIAERRGEIVAFGQVIEPPNPETVVRELLFGGVHPDHRRRGIGRALLGWQHVRALERLAASDLTLPAWVMVYAEATNTGQHRLLESADFAIARYFIKMVRDLAEPVPDLPLPPGLRLVTATPADSARLLAAKNAAFRDHWGSQPSTEEQWTSVVGLAVMRWDLSFLAIDDRDEVVGFVVTQVYDEDFERQGYVGGYIPLIGTVRGWRKQGVAPALIATALRAYIAEGHEKVALDVDAENPTGALGLYTGLGFTEDSRSVAFTREY